MTISFVLLSTEPIAIFVSNIELIKDAYAGFAHYMWQEITFQVTPWYVNYFYGLIVLSLVVWGLELIFPWRKKQAMFRKDFWLDTFYMFFNFYLFKLVFFTAFSALTSEWFTNLIGGDISQLVLFDVQRLPQYAQLIVFFVVTDFVQWGTHFLLHRFAFLWRFHKVHHSVEEMGFAAHLRYHWMENVFYTPVKYLSVAVIGGFNVEQVYIVYYFAIAIGHLNHANLNLSWGPLKYIFNNPVMHIWHHAYALPESRKKGVNFGISLSLWDYLFGTHYIPSSGRDIKLGFEGMENYPKTFWSQLFSGFSNTNR